MPHQQMPTTPEDFMARMKTENCFTIFLDDPNRSSTPYEELYKKKWNSVQYEQIKSLICKILKFNNKDNVGIDDTTVNIVVQKNKVCQVSMS